MSELVCSEGIVIVSRPFRESSKIATVLTCEDGRADLLARGARRPGSRFGAALEPGTHARFIYYRREEKTLWTLSSADIIRSNQHLRENPPTYTLLAQILRLLNHISQPGEENTGLYNFTLACLNAIRAGKSPAQFFDFYLWRIVTLSGYPPRVDEGCMVCGDPVAERFSIAQGGFLCSRHLDQREDTFLLTSDERKLLSWLGDITPCEFQSHNRALPSHIPKLIRAYARYHLHADRKLVPPSGSTS